MNRRFLLLTLAVLILAMLWRVLAFTVSPLEHHHRIGDEPLSYRMARAWMTDRQKPDTAPRTDDERKSRWLSWAYLGAGGQLPGPLPNALLGTGLRLTGDVEGAHLAMLVMHLLALVAALHAAWILAGPRVALLTALMTGFFYYPVFYSQTIWHPNGIPFMAAFCFWGLTLWHKRGSFAGLVFSAFILTIFPQFHLIGAFLIFFFLFYVVFLETRRLRFLAASAVGLAFGLILGYPAYLSHEFASGFANLRNLFNHDGIYFETLKVISNMVLVGSAENSGLIFGGFAAVKSFYAVAWGHLAVAVPFLVLTIALPVFAYVWAFRSLWSRLRPWSIRGWFPALRGMEELPGGTGATTRDLVFLMGWILVPWFVYTARLKYHELRFVGLDFPVMHVLFALALNALATRWGWNKVGVLFGLVVATHMVSTVGHWRYGKEVLHKPPHLIYSLRLYDPIGRAVEKDLGGAGTWALDFPPGDHGHWAGVYRDFLYDHVSVMTDGRVLGNPASTARYRLVPEGQSAGAPTLSKIQGLALIKVKPDR